MISLPVSAVATARMTPRVGMYCASGFRNGLVWRNTERCAVATPWRRNLAAAREAKALTASAISSCVRNAWTQHLPYRRWRGMAGPLSNSLCAGSMPPRPATTPVWNPWQGL